MASTVEICNRALSKLGQIRITSLTDNNKAAKACNQAYEYVRDSVLRAHVWNCTVSRAQLAPLSTTPAFGFDYEYQQPSDCIKVVEVDTSYQWVVEGRKILTDQGTTLDIRYQVREEDPNQYDSLLQEAIAARLAYELAEELTQSNSKKEAALNDYHMTMSDAKLRDAQEQSPAELYEDDWINVRY